MSETTHEETPAEVPAETPAEDTPPAAEVETVPGEEALGDPGKKALDSMKAEKREAIARAKAAEERIAALEAKLNGQEAEYAAAQEAQRLKDEAIAAANERILKAEVRAHAAGKLSDPADALRFLDLSAFEVGADGDVDAAEIASAIDGLITTKPYLAAQSGKKFQGSADGGTRNDAGTPSQLTEADVKRLSAEGRHEEIVRAKNEGRLNDYLGRS